MKIEKHKKIVRYVELIGFIIILIALAFFLINNYKGNVGKAIEQNSDTFVESFDSSPARWTPGNAQITTITEEALNREFKGISLSNGISEKISLSQSDMGFNADSGEVWLRIKLNNNLYSEDEFLPFMLIGNMLLFKGSTQEGHINDQGSNAPPPIDNGKDIFIGSYYNTGGTETGYYKKLGTWKKDEWHEIFITWYTQSTNDCDSGKEYIVSVSVDNSIIPANSAVDCSEDCEDWTMWFCDDFYFPITSTDDLILMPSLSQVSQFSKTPSAQAKSGFFIDKIAVSEAELNEFYYALSDETIVNNNPAYWSGLIQSININNQPSSQTLISNITNKCKVFNMPEQNGIISLSQQNFGNFTLAIEGSNLKINNIQSALNIRKSIELDCANNYNTDSSWISVNIGVPEIFKFYFISNNKDEINVSMEKNSQKDITYFVSNIDRDSTALSHTVTGESIVTESHYPSTQKISGNHKVILNSNSQTGTETLTLKITNDNTGEYIIGKIHVTVWADNQPPVIQSYYPSQQKVKINISKEITFRQTSTDDKGANLQYSWYLNNILKAYIQNYTYKFNDKGNYSIKLIVSDGQLNTEKIWNIEVVDETIPTNNPGDNNDSDDGTTPQISVCGNNIIEPGEECDTNKKIPSCAGLPCLSNCKCNWSVNNQGDNPETGEPQQNNDTPAAAQNNAQTQWNNVQNSPQQETGTSYSSSSDNAPETQQDSQSEETKTAAATTKKTGNDSENNLGKTTAESKTAKEFEKKSPEDKLFTTLLWILLGLTVVPFIIIGTSKLSKLEPKTKEPLKIKNPNYNHQKLSEILNWYKSRGMTVNSAYNMLLRMGFNKQHAYSLAYHVFYKRR